MSKRVCPWWLGYFLASPVRRWALGDPGKMLAPYVREGMTVFEPGPGMGFFTLELSKLIGSSGRVIAVDVQPKMISALKRRAAKAGTLDRIDVRQAVDNSLSVNDCTGKIDFTLAFAVVHEMPSASWFFSQAAAVSKPGATLLFAEPSGHVKEKEFEAELQDAVQAGFVVEKEAVDFAESGGALTEEMSWKDLKNLYFADRQSRDSSTSRLLRLTRSSHWDQTTGLAAYSTVTDFARFLG